MKKVEQALFLLLFSVTLSAQNEWKIQTCTQVFEDQNAQDNRKILSKETLSDFFPLNVGNEFTYSYQRLYSYNHIDLIYRTSYGNSEKDSGVVVYSIVGKEYLNDTTISWRVKEHTELLVSESYWRNSNVFDTAYISNQDSLYILNELIIGLHKLSIHAIIWRFDSLYRFDSTDESGVSFFYEHASYFDVPMEFYFGKDTGITKASETFNFNSTETSIGVISSASLKSMITDNITEPKDFFPRDFFLSQNYPNPFNPLTTIKYFVAQAGIVTLKVYDFLGREVATLVNKKESQGIYSVTFDASKLSSGVYFYRLTAGKYMSTKRMMLIK